MEVVPSRLFAKSVLKLNLSGFASILEPSSWSHNPDRPAAKAAPRSAERSEGSLDAEHGSYGGRNTEPAWPLFQANTSLGSRLCV